MTAMGTRGALSTSSGFYDIRIKGRLDSRWRDRLEGLSVTHPGDGTTKLSGQLADQAALHGILNRIRDLGLAIISVQLVGSVGTGEEIHDRS